MTQRLDKAIATLRSLPDDEQDLAADMLLIIAHRHGERYTLDEPERIAVREGLAEADRGEFIPDSRVDDLLKRPWR